MWRSGRSPQKRRTIRQLLTNPAYVGDHRYNLRSRGKYYQLRGGTLVERQQHWQADGETATTEFNDDADLIYAADRWPAVVDRKTWDAAQGLLADNRKNTAPSRDYLFSSLLYCQCDSRRCMHGHKQTTKRYLCSDCGATASEAELLEHVTTAIRREYSTERLQELRDAIERKLRGRSKQQQNGADTKPIKAKLQRYEKRLLEVDSDMVAIVQAEIRSLRQQLAEAERQSKAAVQVTGDMQKQIDRALADFFRLPKAIHRKPPAEVRRCFQQAIDRIEVQIEVKQCKTRKKFSLAGLDIHGAVKPVLSQLAWYPFLV